MGWASGGQSPGGPEFQANFNKTNFPVVVKIRTSGYQTLECFCNTPNFGLNPSLTVSSSLTWQCLSTSVRSSSM